MKSLWNYLVRRFQLIPLSVLVISDVLVISRIADLDADDFVDQAAVFLLVILYLFSNRVGDDKRDFEFDRMYYPDRAVQKGEISLKMLEYLGVVALFSMLVVAYVLGSVSMILVLPVWLFSIWAKRDFFLPSSFKVDHFFVYNFLNMLQMLVLQVFVYCSLLDSFVMTPLIWVHIAFVFILSLQVEVTRKIKTQQTVGNDQYSDRIGMGKSIIMWLSLGILSHIFFYSLGFSMHIDSIVLSLTVVGCLALMIATGVIYYKTHSAKYEGLFWMGMIGSYVGQNLVLAYG